MSEMREHALMMANRGFAVHPLRAGTKEPLLTEWQKKATPHVQSIEGWWNTWPNANVGVATGSGIVVIDVDVKGERQGVATMETLNAQLGEPPSTYTVRTASGGWHIYYRVRDRIPNSAGKLGDGIDVRGDGGFVVAAGSVVDGASYVAVRDIEIAELTLAPWLDKLRSHRTLDSLIVGDEDVAPGEQHDQLFAYAVQLCRDRVDRQTAGRMMWQMAQSFDCSGRPWSRLDITHMLNSMEWHDGSRVLQGVPHMTPIAAVRLDELLQNAPPKVDGLPTLGRRDIFFRRHVNLLSAGPKVGKTTFLNAVIPEWIRAGHRVLYLTEESLDLWYERAQDYELTGDDLAGLSFVPGFGQTPMALLRQAKLSDADVVVIDTIRFLTGIEDESKPTQIRKALDPWIAWCRAEKRTLILVHHNRKKGSGDPVEDVSGANAFTGAVDQIIGIARENVPTHRKLRTRGRFGDDLDIVYGRMDAGDIRILLGA